MRPLSVTLLGLICVAMVACSSGSSSTPTAVPTRTPAVPAPATASATETSAVEIKQQNLQFVPTTVRVHVGDVVLFTSSDPSLHMIKVDSTIIAGTQKNGDMVRWKAPSAGQYKVTCDYHPQMTATIDVTP